MGDFDKIICILISYQTHPTEVRWRIPIWIQEINDHIICTESTLQYNRAGCIVYIDGKVISREVGERPIFNPTISLQRYSAWDCADPDQVVPAILIP